MALLFTLTLKMCFHLYTLCSPLILQLQQVVQHTSLSMQHIQRSIHIATRHGTAAKH